LLLHAAASSVPDVEQASPRPRAIFISQNLMPASFTTAAIA